jgi:hypothetical protein
LVTLLMCVFNVCGYLFIKPNAGAVAFQIGFITAIIVVSYIVLWFFWNGRNWARILVLITSVLALLNLIWFNESGIAERCVIIAEFMLAVFLLYWLNTRPIVSYFKQ